MPERNETMLLKRLLLAIVVYMLWWPSMASASPEAPVEGSSQAELAQGWLYDFMVQNAPPGRKSYYEEDEETKEEAEARYHSIAKDIVEVAFDPGIQPAFGGPNGRARTASLIAAIMFHESSFRRRVDYALGKYGRGDHGRSWCMMQLNIGEGRTVKWNWKHQRLVRWNDAQDEVFEGYTGPELIQDRKRCIREGLRVIRSSFKVCSKLPLLERLSAYASGNCRDGLEKSRTRMGTAVKFFQSTRDQRRLFTDAGVQLALSDIFDARRKEREAWIQRLGEGVTEEAKVLRESDGTATEKQPAS